MSCMHRVELIVCVFQTLTVIAEVERPDTDAETPVTEVAAAEVDVSYVVPPREPDPVSTAEENSDVDLSELKQALPQLPPKVPQVPPRLGHSRPACSQSFSAAPPRPPAFRPKIVQRAQSSTSSGLPPLVPPRAPGRTSISGNQSKLSSRAPPVAASLSSIVVPHHVPQPTQHSPDGRVLGSTSNYVYFTGDTVPPATQLAARTKKPKYPPGLYVDKHASLGKKLADSGIGAVNAANYISTDDNPAGSYVRLEVTTPTSISDPLVHEYCYPSIDAVVPAPTVCRIEPHHALPPLPTKSRRVGWWDRRRRRPPARCSELRATWSPRTTTTYGTEEPSFVTSHLSLNNSQSSSLNNRRPTAAWRSRLLCFVRTCIHPCRWRRRWRRRSLPGRTLATAT